MSTRRRRIRAGRSTLAVLLLVGAGPPAARAERAVPFLTGRVVDEAGMVPQPVRDRLELRLRDLEQATGAQVAILIVESLEGEPLEQYSLRVAETWKLGGAERDDGVLLFVARADRKMRLEVGYGLEDRLTDLRSRRIRDEVMAPRFKAGDFGGGFEEAVKAIEAVIRGGELAAPLPPAPVAPTGASPFAGEPVARLFAGCIFLVVIGVFSLLALFGEGPMPWILYVFLMPFHCAFPAGILTPMLGAMWFGLWLVGFPVARWLVRKRGWGEGFRDWMPASTGAGGGSWSWGSSSSGDSGGSSFSGGGGSFGGGGASSSW